MTRLTPEQAAGLIAMAIPVVAVMLAAIKLAYTSLRKYRDNRTVAAYNKADMLRDAMRRSMEETNSPQKSLHYQTLMEQYNKATKAYVMLQRKYKRIMER